MSCIIRFACNTFLVCHILTWKASLVLPLLQGTKVAQLQKLGGRSEAGMGAFRKKMTTISFVSQTPNRYLQSALVPLPKQLQFYS